jgi:hypothetical protein
MVRVSHFGWFYIPRSPLALAIAAVMLAFCAQVFLAVDHHSHSVSDTLYGVFPFWATTFLLWNWVGGQARS